ncbi:AAA family ATPase [uncultured Endozoicomonas sp.]|uniref:AAA family ATPase n=1 Tax=uncultured Endozoicomonas sp. TaxID=432652 RepID=UPI002623FAEC|nr:AAA family ATPase [uncultured Endozoicomonas sp.]
MFTLKKIVVCHKNKVLYNVDCTERSENDRDKLLTTLIIGENGVGKSFLLKIIADFFRFVTSERKSANIKYDQIKISYELNRKHYEIEKNLSILTYKKDSIEVSVHDIDLPSKVVALSFMVNDKFSFVGEDDDFGLYRYLGVRATSNATYTSTIQKKLLSSILKILGSKNRVESLNSIFDFIGLNNKIEISYRLKRKTLFTRGVNKNNLQNKLQSVRNRKKYISNTSNITNASIIEVIDLIEKIKSTGNYNKNEIIFSLSTQDINSSLFLDSTDNLELMEKLELISSPEIKFVKSDIFDFEHTSSGEKHFIFTMINLISSIEKNSLVLIDEPELSLHPRWQMKYIRLLKSITTNFKTSHCLLASHSHFMVSDLDPKSSTLISFYREINNGVEHRSSQLIPFDTYAWSAENILYEVFKLRTTRNSYFEQDLSKLLQLISSCSDDKERISYLQNKLEAYRFNDNDPINVILDQSRSYLKRFKNDI